MPGIVIVIACIGLIAVIAGVVALRSNWRFAQSEPRQAGRRLWLAMTFALGAVLGIASWPLTFWMGYPVHVETEVGRIVGIPFFVAYFDSAGRDYVGALTIPGAFANAIFWFIAPQLALYAINRRRRGTSAASA
jgi:hypothetical protein